MKLSNETDIKKKSENLFSVLSYTPGQYLSPFPP